MCVSAYRVVTEYLLKCYFQFLFTMNIHGYLFFSETIVFICSFREKMFIL